MSWLFLHGTVFPAVRASVWDVGKFAAWPPAGKAVSEPPAQSQANELLH